MGIYEEYGRSADAEVAALQARIVGLESTVDTLAADVAAHVVDNAALVDEITRLRGVVVRLRQRIRDLKGDPDPVARFVNDPGSDRVYMSWNSYGSDWKYHFDFREDLAKLAVPAGVLYPGYQSTASADLKESCYRAFGPVSQSNPNAVNVIGSHSSSRWSEMRQALANVPVVSRSLDVANRAGAQKLVDGYWDSGTQLLARELNDVYDRYQSVAIFDFSNEPDAWGNSPLCHDGLALALMRRGARRFHFKLLEYGANPDSFIVSNPMIFNMTGYQHPARHARPVNNTSTWSEGDRRDAIYYYNPDWKGTRTVADGFWSDAFNPNPVDFYQEGERDQWGYGAGPIMKVWSGNSYEKTYEYTPAWNNSKAAFRNAVFSSSGRYGNYLRFNRALYGDNGLPIFLGEWGYGIYEESPTTSDLTDTDTSCDGWVNYYLPDLIESNVFALNKWRHVQAAYDSPNGSPTDTHTFHWHVGAGKTSGTRRWDPNNVMSKAFVAMMKTPQFAPPLPHQPLKPQHL